MTYIVVFVLCGHMVTAVTVTVFAVKTEVCRGKE